MLLVRLLYAWYPNGILRYDFQRVVAIQRRALLIDQEPTAARRSLRRGRTRFAVMC